MHVLHDVGELDMTVRPLKILIPLAALVIWFAGCAPPVYVSSIPRTEIPHLFKPLKTQPCTHNKLTHDEYAVIATAIDSMLLPWSTTVVFIDSTITIDVNDSEAGCPALPLDSTEARSIRADFERLNSRRYEICASSIPVARGKVVFSDSAFNAPFKKYDIVDVWDAFREMYRSSFGVLSFSRVAFDSKGNYALVYADLQCGALCGSGEWMLMHKEGREWKVVKRYLVWIS